MTTISIIPEKDDARATRYSAISATRRATGRTVGEALDALAAQPSAESATMAIVQMFSPDQFFSATQRERLSALMSQWRTARKRSKVLPSADQDELEKLVDEELLGAGQRAEHFSLSLEKEDLGLQQQLMKLRRSNKQARRVAFAIEGFLVGLVPTVIAATVLTLRGELTFAIIALIGSAFGGLAGLIYFRRQDSALERTVDLQERRFYELLEISESLEPEPTRNQHDSRIRSK